MEAWVIRPERLGDPIDAMQLEQIDVPDPGHSEVLVRVMAAGVNYNGVWASLGLPVSIFRYTGYDFHIAGSDASGIVERVGPGVTRWSPGDEVVIHCNQSCGECAECNGPIRWPARGRDPLGPRDELGSFAEYSFAVPAALASPPGSRGSRRRRTHLFAYRMLVDRAGMRAGDNVLVWGAGGGLGTFAVALPPLGASVAVARRTTSGSSAAGRNGGARRRARAQDSAATEAQLREINRFGRRQGCLRRLRRRHRVRACRRGHVLHLGLRVQDVWDDRDLQRDLGVARLRVALPVDAAEDDPRGTSPTPMSASGRTSSSRRARSSRGSRACSRGRSAPGRTR